MSSLITDPSERSGESSGRRERASGGRFRWTPEKSRFTISATASMSRWCSFTKMGARWIMESSALEISDLPPPETVHGLWQRTPSGRVPIRRQVVPPDCFSRWIR